MRDRKYSVTTTLRLTEDQKAEVESLCEEMDVSESEFWRRLLFIAKVLFSDRVALADALRPIPDIIQHVDEKNTPASAPSIDKDASETEPTLHCDNCGFSVHTDELDLEDALTQYRRHDCDAATVSNDI